MGETDAAYQRRISAETIHELQRERDEWHARAEERRQAYMRLLDEKLSLEAAARAVVDAEEDVGDAILALTAALDNDVERRKGFSIARYEHHHAEWVKAGARVHGRAGRHLYALRAHLHELGWLAPEYEVPGYGLR